MFSGWIKAGSYRINIFSKGSGLIDIGKRKLIDIGFLWIF
jgi:hypothetical protein